MAKLSDKLKKNQEAVLKRIGEIGSLPAAGGDARPNNNIDSIKKASEKADYSTAIFELNKQRDARNGIIWHEPKKENDDKEQAGILVRDARNMVKGDITNGYEAYAIQFLNSVRATKVLIEGNDSLSKEQKDAANTYLDQKASVFLNKVSKPFLNKVSKPGYADNEKNNIKTVKEANRGLLDFYKGVAGVDEKTARKQIATAGQFASFDDRHYHTVTLHEIEHNGRAHVFFEADVALLGLTEQQKKQYKAIKDESTQKKPEWFSKLPKWEQNLVQRYAPKISDGEHVIPTQLRTDTVGMRNAYNKVTGTVDSKGNATALHQAFHAGTVSAQTKGNNQSIADMNVQQAAEFAGKDVHLVTLNTPHNPTGNDKDIVNQTSKATGQTNSHSNFAFNALRRGGPNKSDGAKELLGAVVGNYKEDYEKSTVLSRVLNGKSSNYQGAKDAIEDLKVSGRYNPNNGISTLIPEESRKDTIKVLELSLELRKLLDNNKSPFDKENRNLKITTLITRIGDLVDNGNVDGSIIDKGQVKKALTMCQSGKDRTGVFLYNTTSEVIINNLQEKGNLVPVEQLKLQQNVHSQIAKDGHTQQQAGWQGGTAGCFGVKAESISGMAESWGKAIHNTLSQKTASFNKFKVDEPGVFQRFANSVRKLFGAEVKPHDQVAAEQIKGMAQKEGSPIQQMTQGLVKEPEKSQGGLSELSTEKSQGTERSSSEKSTVVVSKGEKSTVLTEQSIEEGLVSGEGGSQEPYKGLEKRQRSNATLRTMTENFDEQSKEAIRESVQVVHDTGVKNVGEGQKVTKQETAISKEKQEQDKNVGKV